MSIEAQAKVTIGAARRQCAVHGVEWTPALEAAFRNSLARLLAHNQMLEEELAGALRRLEAASKISAA